MSDLAVIGILFAGVILGLLGALWYERVWQARPRPKSQQEWDRERARYLGPVKRG